MRETAQRRAERYRQGDVGRFGRFRSAARRGRDPVLSDRAAFTLDHIQLAIPDGGEEDARGFYVDVLGFTEVEKPEHLRGRGGLWLRSGATNVHLGIDRSFVAAKKAHPAFRASSYDALRAALESNGLAVAEDPDLFNGARHFYIDDPFGNRIEIIDGATR